MTAKAFLTPQLEALVSRNWDVHLACDPVDGVEELAQIHGVTLHPIPMQRNPSPLKDLASLIRWNKLVRKLRPDIVIGSTPKAALLSMLSGKWNKIPVRIYHARGFRAEGLTGVKGKIALLAERRTAQAATKILCDSESLRKALITTGCLEANSAIVLGAGSCCGVDTHHFRPPSYEERTRARTTLGFKDSDFIVGFVGRVTRDKGIVELIQASMSVNNVHPSVNLILVGPDEGAGNLLTDPKATDSVKYLGPYTDVRSAYWAFDAFALPSYREGFPIAPLEAQSCGLPLITTTATGCIDSQTPSNHQLLVPPRDSGAIAQAITYLYENPTERAIAGTRARNWVETNFRQDLVIRNHIDYLSGQVGI
jgi:glycosyltransferase involved in cell wall biosynthesis